MDSEYPVGRLLLGNAEDDDANDLSAVCNGFLITVAGALKINDRAGNTHTIAAMPVGWHPIQVSRVWTNGSDATLLAGMYLGYTA